MRRLSVIDRDNQACVVYMKKATMESMSPDRQTIPNVLVIVHDGLNQGAKTVSSVLKTSLDQQSS